MKKYSEDKLINVLNKILKRTERRKCLYIDKNPLMANASIDFVFSTKLELSIVYFCKQALMRDYPCASSNQARARNMRVVELAKEKGVTRTQARKIVDLELGEGIQSMFIDSNVVDISERIK